MAPSTTKPVLAFAAVALLASAWAGVAGGQAPARACHVSVATLLRRNTLARGGAAALSAVRTLESTIEIREQGAMLKGRYRATKDGLMRIDVFYQGKRVDSEGVDRAGSWEWPGGKPGPAPTPDVAKGILERGVETNLYSLESQARRGAKFTLDRCETVAGVNYFVVRAVAKDGFESFLYFDPADWLVKRSRDFRALHPDNDPSKKWLEEVYEDFARSQGILNYTSSYKADIATGKHVQESRFLSQVYNRPADKLDLSRDFAPAPPPGAGAG